MTYYMHEIYFISIINKKRPVVNIALVYPSPTKDSCTFLTESFIDTSLSKSLVSQYMIYDWMNQIKHWLHISLKVTYFNCPLKLPSTQCQKCGRKHDADLVVKHEKRIYHRSSDPPSRCLWRIYQR